MAEDDEWDLLVEDSQSDLRRLKRMEDSVGNKHEDILGESDHEAAAKAAVEELKHPRHKYSRVIVDGLAPFDEDGKVKQHPPIIDVVDAALKRGLHVIVHSAYPKESFYEVLGNRPQGKGAGQWEHVYKIESEARHFAKTPAVDM